MNSDLASPRQEGDPQKHGERKSLRLWQTVLLLLCAVLAVGVSAYFGNRGRLLQLGFRAKEEEEAFVRNISAIPAMDPPVYETVSSAEAFFTQCRPNLIVRVRTVGRGKAVVHDPAGEYTEQDIRPNDGHGIGVPANAYIATPYDMEITELLFAHPAFFRIGDTFSFYAPYGEIPVGTDGSCARIRYDHYPILMTDREYLLFLRVSGGSSGTEYELCHPCGALEITAEDPNTFRTVSDLGDIVFRECGSSVAALSDLVTRFSDRLEYGIPDLIPFAGP